MDSPAPGRGGRRVRSESIVRPSVAPWLPSYLPLPQPHRRPPILRQPLLRNIHPTNDLDPAHHFVEQRQRQSLVVVKNTVDPVPNNRESHTRLYVYVTGPAPGELKGVPV